MNTSYRVSVSGRDKGEVYRARARWHWFNDIRGTEGYGRHSTIDDVRDHIARLCKVSIDDVVCTKSEDR